MEPSSVSPTNSRDERPLPPIPAAELSAISVGELPGNSMFASSSNQDNEGRVEEILEQENSARRKAFLKSRASQASSAGISATDVSIAPYEGAQQGVRTSNDGYRGNSHIRASTIPDTANSMTGISPVLQPKDSNETAPSSAGAVAIALAQSVGSVSRVFLGGQALGSDPPGGARFLSQTLSPSRREQQYDGDIQIIDQAQFVVPRWQPDAEVTLCPICGTQFSFFVRKHHCRKCGRVVCGNCSPHRITIPFSYIVQPSSKAAYPTTISRPTPEYARAESSSAVENLGGGERVRLCNPCVPDPNIAPLQVADNPRRLSQQGRGRSVSETVAFNHSRNLTQTSANSPAIYTQQRRPRQPRNLSPSNPTTLLYPESSNSLMRSEELNSRSRSSTVGTTRTLGNSASSSAHTVLMNRPPRELRATLREEDECWVCHRELPSSSLSESERLRQEHVLKCISDAERGSSSSTQALPSTSLYPSPSGDPSGQAESSRVSQLARSVPTPTANTPEARMAARENAHATVVHAAQSSVIPTRRVGLISYKASEKDCVDDAECTICLEEFEVGGWMGRLECFCRFHCKCIQQWFALHPGQCPVHQHGAGY
ncbi:fyve domain containing protein [Diplocarpon rosae]|nr:fyve domain containing protein [Diplocarpon rosae]